MTDHEKNTNPANKNETNHPIFICPYQGAWPPNSHEQEINVIDIWLKVSSKKDVFFCLFFCCLLGSVIYAFTVTPIYRAKVTFFLKSSDAMIINKNFWLSMLQERQKNKELAIETLRSRSFINKFIEDEALLPIVFQHIWDKQNKKWRVDNFQDIPTLEGAYQIFQKICKITAKKGGLISFRIDWTSPKQAAQWANILISRLNKRLQQIAIEKRRIAIHTGKKIIKRLKREMIETESAEARKAIGDMIVWQMTENIVNKVYEGFVLQIIDPAYTPDDDDFIYPKRALIISIGFFVGVFLGVTTALILASSKHQTVTRKPS